MRYALILLATVGLSSTAAFAADPAPSNNLRAACKADVQKLCSDVQPGGHRIAACLKQNETKVSAACKDALAKSRDKNAAPATNAPQTPSKSSTQG